MTDTHTTTQPPAAAHADVQSLLTSLHVAWETAQWMAITAREDHQRGSLDFGSYFVAIRAADEAWLRYRVALAAASELDASAGAGPYSEPALRALRRFVRLADRGDALDCFEDALASARALLAQAEGR